MPFRSLTLAIFALLAVTFSGRAAAQNILISEFVASNHAGIADEDGDHPDWLELYNPGASAVNLDGWYLTDNASKPTKWRIPAVSIAANGFLLVYCDSKDRSDPNLPLHTNFKLGASGSYLGLRRPDGVTVSSEYAPAYPAQQTDVSYGIAFDGGPVSVVVTGAPATALVPTSGALGLSWTALGFDDTAWASGTTGVGFEHTSGYEPLIGLDVGADMYGKQSSAFIRIPFTVDDPSALTGLTLRMKYDDGFVAYLNGVPVASANTPADVTWNSAAPVFHDDSLAVKFQDFDVSASIAALQPGANVLAIQGLNNGSTSTDFLMIPELVGSSPITAHPGSLRYFSDPTPGAPNASSVPQGPTISAAEHTPNVPEDGQDLVVTARVAPALDAVQAVSLAYRVDYGAEVTIPMADDGTHGDGDAEDGVYGATIPESAYAAGQMVRYAISATDAQNRASRLPLFASADGSAQYLGTMVADPSVETQLPVLYWWVQNPAAANTETGTQASIFYKGKFYDNIFVRLRGNTSASWPKKNLKFDLNSGAYFDYDPNRDPVEEFNLQSTFSDKSYMRQVLAWATYADAGVPGSDAFHVRVQQNGAFYSVAEWVEQPDETMLARNGLDPNGALYKMYNELTDAQVREDWVEKKTRENEDSSDLQALVNGVTLSGADLTNYLFDNVDVPEMINYCAATVIMHDNDQIGKNYYLYRDSDGNKEWKVLPWDKDLTFGRNFTLQGGVLNDTIWAATDPYSHPFFGDRNHPKVDGPWNRLIDALYREPTIRAMYLRRLRTLMDDLLQPPGTPAPSLKFEARIDALVNLIGADVVQDRAKWGVPYGQNQDLSYAVTIMKSSYLAARRNHLFNTHSTPGDGLIPGPQVGVPALAFGAIERSPASGNDDEEFIEIVNPTGDAADISGWTLSGDVDFTFAPGTVVPAHGSLYVSPDVNAFRARASAPTGGMGLLVVGDYSGHLKSEGAPVFLKTNTGVQVAPAPLTMAGAQSALAIASGLAAATSDDLARLNVDQSGESDGVVDASDALGIARSLAGVAP
jgi:hypothetical protein